LAKVIKKAAIQIPEEKTKPPARKPPRPVKGKGKIAVVEQAPAIKADEVKGGEDARGGKGKKKGKRLVQFRSGTEEQGGRLKKGFGGKRKVVRNSEMIGIMSMVSVDPEARKAKRSRPSPFSPSPRPRLSRSESKSLRLSALVIWPTGCQ
jgi:hypothetical protein